MRREFSVLAKGGKNFSCGSRQSLVTMGAIHSTKISGNFGPKLNGSVRSNRKSFEKTGPPFEVDHFSRSDRLEFWLNGSRHYKDLTETGNRARKVAGTQPTKKKTRVHARNRDEEDTTHNQSDFCYFCIRLHHKS